MDSMYFSNEVFNGASSVESKFFVIRWKGGTGRTRTGRTGRTGRKEKGGVFFRMSGSKEYVVDKETRNLTRAPPFTSLHYSQSLTLPPLPSLASTNLSNVPIQTFFIIPGRWFKMHSFKSEGVKFFRIPALILKARAVYRVSNRTTAFSNNDTLSLMSIEIQGKKKEGGKKENGI